MAFSKSEVNRAGDIVSNQIRDATEGRFPTSPAEIDEFGAAIEVVDWWRSEHARPLTLVAANLRHYAARSGPPIVAQRLKRLPTIARKMIREPRMKLARMGDIGGVRAVVLTQEDAFRMMTRLQRNWTIVRVSDYVSEPKLDGYRALHLINRHRGRLVEVQIRTALQDNWANTVEIVSRSQAPGLKFGEGPPLLQELFRDLGALYADVEAGRLPTRPARAKLREIEDWVSRFGSTHDES